MKSEFQFSGFNISKIDYRFIDDESIKGKDTVSFAYKIEKSNSNAYDLYLYCRITDADRDDESTLLCEIGLTGNYLFSDKNEFSEAKKEEIIKVNGSAILFPYLRTLLQTISSFDTTNEKIMLPTLNIAKLIKDIDKKNISKEKAKLKDK